LCDTSDDPSPSEHVAFLTQANADKLRGSVLSLDEMSYILYTPFQSSVRKPAWQFDKDYGLHFLTHKLYFFFILIANIHINFWVDFLLHKN